MTQPIGRRRGGHEPGPRRPAVRTAAPPGHRLDPRAILRHPAIWSGMAALALYLPAIAHGFVWDDHRVIELNLLLRSVPGTLRLLVSDFWHAAGSDSGYWRPLVTLTYALDGLAFGWRAAGFHLTNALAHALAAAALASLVLQSGLPRLAALAGGLWFAVMPAHVEPVAWISGRTDVLCALFTLVALGLDRRDRRAGRNGPSAAALAAFAAALLSKETAVLAVGVFAIAERVERPGGRSAWRERIRWLGPYLVLALAWAALHRGLVRAAALPPDLEVATLERGRWAAWTMLPGYLGFLLPWVRHSPQMMLRLPTGPLAPEVVAGVLLHLAGLAWLGGLLARRSRLAVPLGLFALTLSPSIVLLAARSLLLYSERFLYLPSAGVAWMLAEGIARIPRGRVVRGAAVGLVGGWILWSGVAAARALPAWREDFTLFRQMAMDQPRNATARLAHANELLRRGREDEARAELAVARALDPRAERLHLAQGLLAWRHGDWSEVLAQADSGLARDPRAIPLQRMRATALLRLGRLDPAEAAIARLRDEAPGDPGVDALWGQVRLMRGAHGEALAPLEAASRFIHDDADLAYALGMAYARLDRVDEARRAFDDATRLDPDFYEGWLRLATARHLLGDAAGREAALGRAAALPEARDGRVALLRARLAGTP